MSKIFETDKYDFEPRVFNRDEVTENDRWSYLIEREDGSPIKVPELKTTKPIRVEGITVYPTKGRYSHSVRCYGIVEELTDEEKDIFFQKHGIQLDPSEHVLIAYAADMEEWTEDYL